MATPRYRIERDPNVTSITQDAQIRFSCVGPRTSTMFADGRQGPAESVRWYRKGEREIGWWDRRMHDLGFGWDKVHKFESLDPGRYMVFAIVRGGRAGKEGIVLGPVYQYVMKDEEVTAFLSKMVEKARKNHLADPNEALKTIDQNIANLNKIASDARFPLTKEQKQQHEETVKKWRQHRAKVKARLASTDGRRRIPLYAVHIAYRTQEKKQLNFFLAKMKVVSGREHWKLVDWTNPSLRAQSSESDGDGMGAEKAIEDVFDEWDWWRGRYPPGKILFQIPNEICGRVVTKTLETDGKTTWDSMIGWLQTGALAAAGVATLVAPIPGSRAASVAIWGTIFSAATGVASEVMAIGQRRAEGIYNAREDTYSALSIVGDLFTAGAARWVRGARVVLKTGKGAKVQKYLFIGSVVGAGGTDVARGVLILEDKFEEYDKIMNDKTLLPEERAQRLHNVFRTLALNGAMIYIGVKGTKGDLTSVANKQGHQKLKGSTGVDEASADLKRLADKDEIIDTTKRVKTKGRADHTETRTTVTTRKRAPLTGSTPGFKEKYPSDSRIWRKHKITDTEIHLQHPRDGNFKNKSKTDFEFMAKIDKNGYVRIRIKLMKKVDGKWIRSHVWDKKGVGRELYEDMFRHFEKSGHPIKGWHGAFAWKNFEKIKEVQKTTGLTLEQAILESHTAKYWKEWAASKNYDIQVIAARDLSQPLGRPQYIQFKVEFVPKKKP